MGDRRRFDLLGKHIATHFPNKQIKIADVAGGKGFLNLWLWEHGYINVTTYDKRHKGRASRIIDYKYGLFKDGSQYDLLVGMHPDEATDVIIVEAVKNNIPFVVVPCCVKPTAKIFNGQHKFNVWVEHLKRLVPNTYNLIETNLKMQGKSLVLTGIPK